MRSVKIYLSSRAPDVEKWSRGEAGGQIIKENQGRTVWRVPVGAPAFYVKRFPPEIFRDRARKEAALLRELDGEGIPCPKVVAWARDSAGSYLLTEEIEGARPLRALLAQGAPERSSLLRSFGALARRLHDRGIEHLDFHVGNVLVKEGELYVLDVHRARRGRPSRTRRLEGVAFAALSFVDLVPLTGLLRFLRAYGVKSREEIVEVCRRLRRRREQYFRGRDARCLKESTGFGREEGIYYRKGVDLASVRAAVRAGGRPVKGSASERVEVLPGGLFVKHTSRARALRTWKNAHALEVRGLPTPRLRACGPGWVVGDWIDAPNVGDLAQGAWSAMSRQARNAFLSGLARLVRRLHELGVYHRDLKSSNILSGPGGCLFVDLDAVRLGRPVSPRERTFNLAQLSASVSPAVTRADRLRFLQAYLGRDQAPGRRRKVWIGQIMTLTRERRHLWPPR
jgi:tRNA A-37 threonylcarbamoyl transferase component Bud32